MESDRLFLRLAFELCQCNYRKGSLLCSLSPQLRLIPSEEPVCCLINYTVFFHSSWWECGLFQALSGFRCYLACCYLVVISPASDTWHQSVFDQEPWKNPLQLSDALGLCELSLQCPTLCILATLAFPDPDLCLCNLPRLVDCLAFSPLCCDQQPVFSFFRQS